MVTRRKSGPHPSDIKQLSLDDINLGITKLKRRIREVENLSHENVSYDDSQVEIIKANISDTIRDVFGENSLEFEHFGYIEIWHGDYIMGDSDFERQRKFSEGIPQAVKILNGLIDRLNEKREDLLASNKKFVTEKINQPSAKTRQVFVVHGHDEAAKLSVARFLEKLDLVPIILQEQPSQGKTVIEKFEKHADVEYAVILLTPDDIVYSEDKSEIKVSRARQNVILELGYFIGRLTRERVCALYKGDIEFPSDIHGVLYTPMDEQGGWKLKLAGEIKGSGIDIDMNKVV